MMTVPHYPKRLDCQGNETNGEQPTYGMILVGCGVLHAVTRAAILWINLARAKAERKVIGADSSLKRLATPKTPGTPLHSRIRIPSVGINTPQSHPTIGREV